MAVSSIEYISIENQTASFPKHFHETFCFSLVYMGVNQIDFNNRSVYSEAGCISIVNPYEIHSNPLMDSRYQTKFETIYVPVDMVKYILNGKNINFVQQTIADKNATRLFLALKRSVDTKNQKIIENYLVQFLDALKRYAQIGEKEYAGLSFNEFSQIGDYIERNIQDKFCLNELAKLKNINKFGFSKKFLDTTGMTPMNYILMRKIFSCKALIHPGSSLTELAYQYNFTDIAHFSKTFKRFIGVSPQEYKTSVIRKKANIIQATNS